MLSEGRLGKDYSTIEWQTGRIFYSSSQYVVGDALGESQSW